MPKSAAMKSSSSGASSTMRSDSSLPASRSGAARAAISRLCSPTLRRLRKSTKPPSRRTKPSRPYRSSNRRSKANEKLVLINRDILNAWTCAHRYALRQTRNREFAAREPLSCGPKPRDHRGWDWHALQFDRVVRVAPGPYPRFAAFDGKLTADRDAMRHVQARAPEFADLGGDVRDIVELSGLEKAGLGVHQRNAHDAEGRAQLVRRYAQCRFEQQPDAPIEKLEEMAVEHDAGRVAMTPFDRESPAAHEIGHA